MEDYTQDLIFDEQPYVSKGDQLKHLNEENRELEKYLKKLTEEYHKLSYVSASTVTTGYSKKTVTAPCYLLKDELSLMKKLRSQRFSDLLQVKKASANLEQETVSLYKEVLEANEALLKQLNDMKEKSSPESEVEKLNSRKLVLNGDIERAKTQLKGTRRNFANQDLTQKQLAENIDSLKHAINEQNQKLESLRSEYEKYSGNANMEDLKYRATELQKEVARLHADIQLRNKQLETQKRNFGINL